MKNQTMDEKIDDKKIISWKKLGIMDVNMEK
jgi:hypothetical protein